MTVEQTAAALIVALTSSSKKRETVAAALARNSTREISQRYEGDIARIWRDASAPTTAFLRLVIQNNPTKTIEQILERADVQQALTAPFSGLAQASEDLIVKGWDESEANAVSKAKGEVALLKAKWNGFRRNRTFQRKVIADVRRNADAMRDRYIGAMREQHAIGRDDVMPEIDPLEKIARDSVLRARYSIQMAVWAVARAVRDSAFQLAGLNKKWQARFGPNMCAHCRALHGWVVGPNEEFPKHFKGLYKLAVYGGKLWGPPRHPNCECIPIATRDARTSSAAA